MWDLMLVCYYSTKTRKIQADSVIRYMTQIKSSLTPEDPEVAFRMSKATGFQWMIERNRSEAKRIKRSAVSELLTEPLRECELPITEIFTQMYEIDISERTIYNTNPQNNNR